MSATCIGGSMEDPEAGATSFGAWEAPDLAETARAEAGVGADSGLPLEVRFTSNVAKRVRKRRAQMQADSDPAVPAVFLLKATPPNHLSGSISSRFPMLDNGMTV